MSFNTDEFYVVDFHFIDDYRCILPLTESYSDDPSEITPYDLKTKKQQLSKLFTDAGWEGDGEINCIPIPPFIAELGGTHCTMIYHVKQSNNGTSWLAIPKNLNPSLPDGFLAKN